MDSAWIAVVMIGTVGTAVFLLILRWMVGNDLERERAVDQAVRYEVDKWCVRSGWTAGTGLQVAAGSPFDPHLRERDHKLIVTARGEVAGRPAELLLGARDDEDGAPAYVAVVVRVPEELPSLQIWQRYIVATLWKAQNPAPPDPSAADTTFHRQLKLGPRTGPDAGALLLTDPVRAALLRLHERGEFKQQFVDMCDGYLQVLVARWPPALDLDQLVTEVTDLTLALSAAVRKRPS
jgi:hypothetical protein